MANIGNPIAAIFSPEATTGFPAPAVNEDDPKRVRDVAP